MSAFSFFHLSHPRSLSLSTGSTEVNFHRLWSHKLITKVSISPKFKGKPHSCPNVKSKSNINGQGKPGLTDSPQKPYLKDLRKGWDKLVVQPLLAFVLATDATTKSGAAGRSPLHPTSVHKCLQESFCIGLRLYCFTFSSFTLNNLFQTTNSAAMTTK